MVLSSSDTGCELGSKLLRGTIELTRSVHLVIEEATFCQINAQLGNSRGGKSKNAVYYSG